LLEVLVTFEGGGRVQPEPPKMGMENGFLAEWDGMGSPNAATTILAFVELAVSTLSGHWQYCGSMSWV